MRWDRTASLLTILRSRADASVVTSRGSRRRERRQRSGASAQPTLDLGAEAEDSRSTLKAVLSEQLPLRVY